MLVAAGTMRLLNDALEVTTAAGSMGLCTVIPVDQTSVPEGSTVRLTLNLEVDSGALQVGVLEPSRNGLHYHRHLQSWSPADHGLGGPPV